MDAPPAHEDCRPFVHVAGLMAAAGLNVPQIIAADLERGFLLLSDLGTTSYLQALDAESAAALFADAIDALLRWQLASRPGVLPPYDEALLRRELDLFPEWYLQRHLRRHARLCAATGAGRRDSAVIRNNLAQPAVYVHRDYMPRNLMLCDAESGRARFPGCGVRADHLRRGLAVQGCLHQLGRGTRARLDACATGRRRGRPGCRSTPISASSTATSNGWACSATSRCWASSRACTTATASPAISKDTPRFIGYVRAVAARYGALAPLLRLLDEIEGKAGASVGYTFLKAMILAAGRGERMRPLTDRTPKPLLDVGGKPLIVWHLEKLARAGFTRVVINHAHLGEQIEAALGDGARSASRIAIRRRRPRWRPPAASPMRCRCWAPSRSCRRQCRRLQRLRLRPARAMRPDDMQAATLAHLVLVDNPAHHPDGDFALRRQIGSRDDGERLTFSGIGVYRAGAVRRDRARPACAARAAAARTNRRRPRHRRAFSRPLGRRRHAAAACRLDARAATRERHRVAQARIIRACNDPRSPRHDRSAAVYRPRRARLAATLMQRGVAIVPHRARAPAQPRRALSLSLRQLFLLPDRLSRAGSGAGAGRRQRSPKSILFCRDKDVEREIWDGFRYGPEAAREAFGFDEAHPHRQARRACCRSCWPISRRCICASRRRRGTGTRGCIGWLNAVRAQARTGVSAPAEIHDVRALARRHAPDQGRARTRRPCAAPPPSRPARTCARHARRAPGRARVRNRSRAAARVPPAAARRRPPTRRSSPAAPTPACCIT